MPCCVCDDFATQDAFRALGGELERLGCLELRKLAKFTGRLRAAFSNLWPTLALEYGYPAIHLTGDRVMGDAGCWCAWH